MFEIRALTAADLAAAMRLKDDAGWNQTEEDWRNVLALAPDGCFGIDVDERLAATATAVCYGSDLAWIGMVLTDAAYRGRGLARALMEHAMKYIEARGIAWTKLDATDMGRPLYLKLGFVDECAVERWRRPPGPLDAYAGGISTAPLALGLDYTAFGADRSALLRTLERYSWVTSEGGHAFMRPGSRATYLGPCVASGPEEARELILRLLVRHSFEPVFWDLLPGNEAAAAIAREFGFERVRSLVRMARPGTPNARTFEHRDDLAFAIAGFEYG
jgi:GNAT superfamily N-acetyltransferase